MRKCVRNMPPDSNVESKVTKMLTHIWHQQILRMGWKRREGVRKYNEKKKLNGNQTQQIKWENLEEMRFLCSERQYLHWRSGPGWVIFHCWQPNWIIEAKSRETHPWLSLASFCLNYVDVYFTFPLNLAWYVQWTKMQERKSNYSTGISWVASGKTMAK